MNINKVIVAHYCRSVKEKFDYVEKNYLKNGFEMDNHNYSDYQLCSPHYIKVGIKTNGVMKYGIISNFFAQKESDLWKQYYNYNKKNVEIDEWLVPVIPCEYDSIQLIDKAQSYGVYEIVWNSIKFVKDNKSFVLENKLGKDAIFDLSQQLGKIGEKQTSTDLGMSL